MVCNDQNIEYTHHTLPVADVLRDFGTKLQFARVVFESSDEGSTLLARATTEYQKPLAWSVSERASHALWVQGRIDGMEDCIDDPLLFEKYAADFYGRVTNYWYWAIRDSYPKPIYRALEEIVNSDPEYYSFIERFVNAPNSGERLAVAKEIKRRCFGE